MDSPLRHRDFALYVAATVATAFAIEMSFVAIGWQVYAIHGDPLDLGIVGLAMFLPLPLLALPAGHFADRHPRRTVLALATGLDALVALGLLLVTRSGADATWPFFALAFGTGVASAVGAPAGRAMTPSLVPQEILVKAFAQRSVAFQLSVIVGPALGGLLFAIHPELVYAAAAGFSLVALAAILALRAGREGAGAGSPDLASVLGGVRLVRRTPVLLGARCRQVADDAAKLMRCPSLPPQMQMLAERLRASVNSSADAAQREIAEVACTRAHEALAELAVQARCPL